MAYFEMIVNHEDALNPPFVELRLRGIYTPTPPRPPTKKKTFAVDSYRLYCEIGIVKFEILEKKKVLIKTDFVRDFLQQEEKMPENISNTPRCQQKQRKK